MLKIKMKNAGRSIVACLTVLAMLACMVIPVMALGNYTFDEIISNNMAHEEPTIIYHKYGDYCTQHGEYINKKIAQLTYNPYGSWEIDKKTIVTTKNYNNHKTFSISVST